MQKSKALREAAAKLPWAVRPENEVSFPLARPHALRGPQRRLARVAAPAEGDPRVLLVDPQPELAALYLEEGPAGFAAPVCQLLRDRAPPPGRSVQFSGSVVSYSLGPHESQHTRPPCPSPTPGVHSDSHLDILDQSPA